MATIDSAQTGNFTDTATWVGGVVPTTGDIARVLTGHVVTIDSAVTCDEVTNAGNSGYFDLVDGGALTANVTGGASIANNGTVRASMSTSASITGNVTNTFSTNGLSAAVILTGTGTLTVTGNVGFTSTSSDRRAIYSATPDTKLTLVGDVQASTTRCVGIEFTTAATGATVNITGTLNAVGGSSGDGAVEIFGDGSTVVFSGTANGNRYPGLYANVGTGSITASGTFSSNGGSTDSGGYGVRFRADTVTISNATLAPSGSTESACIYLDNSSSTVATVAVAAISAGSAAGYGIRVNTTAGSSTTINSSINLTAGTGNFPVIWASGSSGAVTVNADITGRGAAGARVSSYHGGTTSVFTVNGDVTGNSNAATGINPGISIEGATTRARVNGSVNGEEFGVGVQGIGTLILNGASTSHVQGFTGSAVSRTFVVDPATWSDQAVEYAGLDGLGEFNNGTLITVVDNTEGYPAEADVRSGTDYAASTLTGTLAVPPVESVASGVPVDNTVGTAAVKLADVATVVGAQIAGALDT